MTLIQSRHSLRHLSIAALVLAALAVPSANASAWKEMGSRGQFKLVHEDLPQKGAAKCIVVKLVDEKERTVWAGCDWHTPYAFPWPIWSGGVVETSDAKRLLIVTARSISFATALNIYEVDPRKPPAVAPSYDEKGKLKNSHVLYDVERKPDASFEKDFAGVDMECSMNRRITALELIGGTVRINTQAERLNAKKSPPCPPKVFEYELKSKKWKEAPEVSK